MKIFQYGQIAYQMKALDLRNTFMPLKPDLGLNSALFRPKKAFLAWILRLPLRPCYWQYWSDFLHATFILTYLSMDEKKIQKG